MKTFLFLLLILSQLVACSKGDDGSSNNPPANNGGNNNTDCGTMNGYTLYKDSEGCYYSGSNYSKVYVDASNCTCE